MRKFDFIMVFLILLSLISFYSCRNWNEVKKKDHALQIMIEELEFDKEILILETTHRYLFKRFDEDSIEKAGYKIKFGEKEYFVAQNDEVFFKYALEDNELGYYLMVSMRKFILAPTKNEISVMIVKKMEDLND